MSTQHFQKSKISREVNKAVSSGFSIDKSKDKEYLENEKYNWDDLTKLKDELGNSVIDFISQVNGIVTNQEILANLGDKKPDFDRIRDTFFNDVSEFSHKVKELRVQHEGKSGHVDDITEFNAYNRLAIGYHNLYTELSSLVTPSLSELVLTITEILPNQSVAETTKE